MSEPDLTAAVNTTGELDLELLEEGARLAGLGSVTARVVPADPRRGTWFRWRDGDLSVSQSVIDRCPPGDAQALLVVTIIEERRLVTLRRTRALMQFTGVALATTLWLFGGKPIHVALTFLGTLSVAGVWWSTARARAWFAADDEAVSVLGGAQDLVRGFNRMNKGIIRVGHVRAPLRPDLHRRAERLVRLHRLRCEDKGGTS